MDIKRMICWLSVAQFFLACSGKGLTWHPQELTDTSSVLITCDASGGNRGLYHFKGDVFVHIGVITDFSTTATTWQYGKFVWGSSLAEAKARPAGENKWSFEIPNIRKYFGVPDDERILQIAILFRSGNCSDSCLVQRQKNGMDMFVPVSDIRLP